MGICQLCKEEKKLIKAHVIPYSMYKGIKETGFVIKDPLRKNPSKSPSGIYDPNILCEKCDGDFGLWDNQACQFLKYTDKATQTPVVSKGEIKGYEVINYDYQTLKLFFKSLLFRAHITTHPFFSSVDIGSHVERLRHDLLSRNPGNCQNYGVFIVKSSLSETSEFKGTEEKALISPIKIRLQRCRFYQFIFYGYSFFIKVDHQKLVIDDKALINESGYSYILDKDFTPFLKMMQNNVHNKHAIRP